MNKVQSKIYYDISTGKVLTITAEGEGGIIESTKNEDMNIYNELHSFDINEVDYIKLEYGTLAYVFNGTKSYSVDVETKQLNVVYYSNEELEEMQKEENELMELKNRVNYISTYLSDKSKDAISTFENYIMQTEINKITEGMN